VKDAMKPGIFNIACRPFTKDMLKTYFFNLKENYVDLCQNIQDDLKTPVIIVEDVIMSRDASGLGFAHR